MFRGQGSWLFPVDRLADNHAQPVFEQNYTGFTVINKVEILLRPESSRRQNRLKSVRAVPIMIVAGDLR